MKLANKISIAAALTASIAVSVSLSINSLAIAQTQHWNTAPREKSQRLASAALNRLVLNKIDEAIPLLNEATRADQTDPLPFTLLGMALNIKGRYQEALDALRQANTLNPKSREILLSAGFSQYLWHRYKDAYDSWKKVLDSNPDVVQVYTNIGYAYLRAGKLELAENNLRECAKRSSFSQAAYRGLTLLHYLNGNFPIARSAAQQAGSASGRQVPLLLAEMDFLQGNGQAATKQLSAVPKVSKKGRPTFDMVTVGFLPQHDFHFDPFVSDYFDNESLIEARFVDLPKRESRRVSLARRGKADSAISDLNNLLSNAPNDPYLMFQHGTISLANGNYAEASQNFIKVIQKAPEWHTAKLYLALSRFREGNLEKAKYALEGFEKASPGKQLAPVFAMIKSATLTGAAADKKDDELIIPSGPSTSTPGGDAGF